jgi:hypothetical protein
MFGLLASLAAGQPGVAVNDVFDRPNTTNLGPNWFEGSGDGFIESNRLKCDSPNASWCSYTGFKNPYATTVVSIDFAATASGSKIGVALGFTPSTWGGIEVSLNDNTGSTMLDRIYFNGAINAGNWPTNPTGASVHYNLTTPMASGTLKVWITNNGNTVVAEVTNAATGIKEPLYTASGINSFLFPPTGLDVAVSYARGGACDDFQAWSGQPDGPIYTFTSPHPNEKASFLLTDAKPLSLVGLVVSAGAAPVATPWGTLGLAAPIQLLALVQADATGRAEVALTPLPASLFFGGTIYNQAFDYGIPKLSNWFAVTFQ